MKQEIILLPIIIPLLGGLFVFLPLNKLRRIKEVIVLTATSATLLITIFLFNNNFTFSLPWLGLGLDFSLRLYNLSAFIILAISAIGFLVAMYSVIFMRGKEHVSQFYLYFLLTLALACGAVLADNLILMLFFWEGLLLVLFAMIAIGNKGAFKAATKAFVIVGIGDLCMMIGIALCGHLAQTYTISKIHLETSGLAAVAFILLAIGAISKAGSMPFHTWIPDAATSAPLPFMALVPAALEKLLGIYFLTRIVLDMFKLQTGSRLSILLMVIGAITILAAVMMALIQKNYKRLLSYHAISQVGYMILGIGTASPIGIIGGLFHMLNNAIYKCGLFLSAGSVEKQTGTTNLEELGGLGRRMPITFICFVVTAVSISGVPPFNGFFSKELIYDAALERGFIFYLAALAGSFFTAASFLKLGHAAFLGKISEKNKDIKEAPLAMFTPMIVLSFLCILFGLYNSLPLNKLIVPILGSEGTHGHDFTIFPLNMKLVIATVVVLLLALLNHIFGVKLSGKGLGAVDHIHYAPGLRWIYARAEMRWFDPYLWGYYIVKASSGIAFWLDRKIDWIYDVFFAKTVLHLAHKMRRLHTENYSIYLMWSLIGLAVVLLVLVYT